MDQDPRLMVSFIFYSYQMAKYVQYNEMVHRASKMTTRPLPLRFQHFVAMFLYALWQYKLPLERFDYGYVIFPVIKAAEILGFSQCC